MTKALPAGLQELLDAGATTMAYCWRITRGDGLVQGFTEHDRDLTFDATTFEASTGFTATTMSSELGLSVDNLNTEGALSSDTINEDDLAAGRYDGAEVELFWVNFQDVAQRVLVMRGSIGEVRRGQTAFSAELRGLTHKLQQASGRTYQRYCDADLGDTRCLVDLDSAAFKSTGTVSSVLNSRIVTATLAAHNTKGFFGLGRLTFTSGPNAGVSIPVKEHTATGGQARLVLWEPTPFPAGGGDAFTIYAGCSKDAQTCKTKFANLRNFQGFPYIPGNDYVSRYPNEGGANQNGGSIFNGSIT